jgi:hypothetical protein
VLSKTAATVRMVLAEALADFRPSLRLRSLRLRFLWASRLIGIPY